MLLIATGYAAPAMRAPPTWTIVSCYAAIALGTMFGGWRIVKTMGQKITKLKPVGGFCAETGGALTLFLATALGIPVSTTHTITGAIVGVGSTQRASAVRWGVAGQYRVGLDLHDPGLGVRGGDCLLDQPAGVLTATGEIFPALFDLVLEVALEAERRCWPSAPWLPKNSASTTAPMVNQLVRPVGASAGAPALKRRIPFLRRHQAVDDGGQRAARDGEAQQRDQHPASAVVQPVHAHALDAVEAQRGREWAAASPAGRPGRAGRSGAGPAGRRGRPARRPAVLFFMRVSVGRRRLSPSDFFHQHDVAPFAELPAAVLQHAHVREALARGARRRSRRWPSRRSPRSACARRPPRRPATARPAAWRPGPCRVLTPAR